MVLLKKPGKVKALEDDIISKDAELNFDLVHNVHVGISHTRYSGQGLLPPYIISTFHTPPLTHHFSTDYLTRLNY